MTTASFSIGVDLGGTNLRIAAFTPEGERLDGISLPTRVAAGPNAVVKDMCDAIRALHAKFTPQRSFAGVGVGSPGPIELPSGKLRNLPNFPGFDGFELKLEIERVLGLPAIIENDANAAALAEYLHGAGERHGVDSLAMLTLGTGLGHGLVLQGKVWHGLNGMAGESGHGPLDPNGPACGCGGRGCLEQYASATAISRMAAEAAARGESEAIARKIAASGIVSARELAQLAAEGDHAAQQVYREAGRYLGLSLAHQVNALELPLYVIGGGVSSAWPLFAPALFETLRVYSYVYRLNQPADPEAGAVDKTKISIVPAVLGPDSGLRGAAMLPYQAIGHS